MIKINFIKLMEETEKQAKRHFERHPGDLTPDALIQSAQAEGLDQRDNVDWDLFKHLMKKYHHIGY